MIDLFILLGVWGAALLSVVAAVFSAFYARKNNVRDLRADVDEMAGAVGALSKIGRSLQMQRVRAAAPDQKNNQEQLPMDRASLKSQLRARAAQLNPMRR